MARLQPENLAASVRENAEVVRFHDVVAEGAVFEDTVWNRQCHEVAISDVVDVTERREVRGSMPRDVDQPALARQPGRQVMAGALREGPFVGALDDDHLQTDAPDL